MKRLGWNSIKEQIIDLDTNEVLYTEYHDYGTDFCDILNLPEFFLEEEITSFIAEIVELDEDFSIFGLKFNSKTSQVTGTLKL